jgi:hypothetical protein
MKQKSGPDKAPAEQVLKNIRRQTRRQYSAEEKIRIVLEGLRGEENISELCRREGITVAQRPCSSLERPCPRETLGSHASISLRRLDGLTPAPAAQALAAGTRVAGGVTGTGT